MINNDINDIDIYTQGHYGRIHISTTALTMQTWSCRNPPHSNTPLEPLETLGSYPRHCYLHLRRCIIPSQVLRSAVRVPTSRLLVPLKWMLLYGWNPSSLSFPRRESQLFIPERNCSFCKDASITARMQMRQRTLREIQKLLLYEDKR